MALSVKGAGKAHDGLPQVGRRMILEVGSRTLVQNDVGAQFDGLTRKIVVFAQSCKFLQFFRRGEDKLLAALIIPGDPQHVPVLLPVVSVHNFGNAIRQKNGAANGKGRAQDRNDHILFHSGVPPSL